MEQQLIVWAEKIIACKNKKRIDTQKLLKEKGMDSGRMLANVRSNLKYKTDLKGVRHEECTCEGFTDWNDPESWWTGNVSVATVLGVR